MNKKINFLDYNKLIRENLLNVVKQALSKSADYGLSDGHHFYITLLTKFKGNVLPEYLAKEYPDNMMIVIENEYWNLNVFKEYFSIDLKFKGKIESLSIYYSSLKNFVDPSVSFTLNLDIEEKSDSKKRKTKTVKKKQLENKSNVIFFKPNSK